MTEVVVHHNSPTNVLKVHCENCMKVISKEDLGYNPVTEDAINLFLATAQRHLQRKPKHKANVHVYYRKPTNRELRGLDK